MGSFEDVRKALEEIVSPSLIGLKVEVTGLQTSLTSFRSDVAAMEARIMKAIESAKTEVLLRVQVSDLSARNADLEARLAEAEKERRRAELQQSLASPLSRWNSLPRTCRNELDDRAGHAVIISGRE